VIEILRSIVILLGLSLMICPVVAADGNIEIDSENNNRDIATYILMLFAFAGWSFVLVLLGGGIYHAFHHHRNRKEAEKPLRCK